MPLVECKKCGTISEYANITGTTKKDICPKCKTPVLVPYQSAHHMIHVDEVCEKCRKPFVSGMLPGKSYLVVRSGSHGQSKKFVKRSPKIYSTLCDECRKERE